MSKLKRKFGKRMKYNYKRTFFVLFLFLLLGSFGLVYSYLTTNLSIDGTSNVKSARWDVHFENIQVKDGSVAAETPIISNQTTINFSAVLENPGDFYEFTVDLVNAGTLDSQIGNINTSPQLTEEQSRYLYYRIYPTDGWSTSYLYSGETHKLRVIVEYLETSPEYYPTEDENINFTITLGAVQTSFPKLNGTFYGYQQHRVPINEPIANVYGYTESLTEAAYSGNDHTFIKYNVVNGVIKSADVGLFNNNNYYYLKGGGATIDHETGFYNNDSIYYESNKAVLKSLYGESNCSEYVETYGLKRLLCSGGNIGIDASVTTDGEAAFGWCTVTDYSSSCAPAAA